MVITVMKSIQLYPVIHVSFKNRETQHKQENVAARTDFALFAFYIKPSCYYQDKYWNFQFLNLIP